MNWHILGTGAIGCLLASHLRNNQHNVRLLLRSTQHLQSFQAQTNSILYQRGKAVNKIGGFEASVINDNNKEDNNGHIENLIVATKAHHTAKALEPFIPRLDSNSTILLLQNGMGVVEELEQLYWPQQKESQPILSSRPRVLVGVNRHAVERVAPYHIIHHSGWKDPVGGLMIGEYFTNRISHHETKPLAMELALKQIEDLQCDVLPWDKLYERMIKKLIVNASINPVASILNIKNGDLISGNTFTTNIMYRICQEAAAIIKKDLPSESTDSIYNMVMETCQQVSGNTCSMLQDIKNKQVTEIDYINGYLCKLAKERGIDAPTNKNLVDFIHAKEQFL
ncbi:2-dehydropantoate 2-reductase [Cunninghamella echinulata]|nr:2-dehydropantoate 2-reductase [Cunninghamella echinulata]